MVTATTNLPAAKLSALKKRARQLGMTQGDYLRQLIEDDLELDERARRTPWEAVTEPFRKALSGVSDVELDQLVNEARRGSETKKRRTR